jgi:mannitol-specific phosphotransferase system IIBC component
MIGAVTVRLPGVALYAAPTLNAVNPRRTWLLFSLVRIGLFAVVLAILLLLLTPGGVPPWISALLAAVISLCVSFIFLRKPREEAARSLYEARASTKRSQATVTGDDEDSEDAVVDSTDTGK